MKKCKWCNTEFEPVIGKQKFCSDFCRIEYHNELKRKANLKEKQRKEFREDIEDIGLKESLCDFSCFECPYEDCIK